jgi:O-antigen/teichoic acid export membrane protein
MPALELSRGTPSLAHRLMHNIGSALAGRVIGALLGVVTFGVLARDLGADGLGKYRTVLTMLLFAGIALDFGLYSITLREISPAGADRVRILGNAVALRILATTASALLLLLMLTVTGYEPAVRRGVLIAGGGWVGQQLNELLRSVFQLKLSQHRGAIAETAGAVLSLLLIIALASAHADVDWMLAATAAGFLCTAALSWRYADRLIPLRPRVDWTVWRGLILMGLPMAASVILLNIQLRADVLFLSLLRDPREVGLYDVPMKLYELLYVAPALFGGLMLPLFVRDYDGGRSSLVPRLNAALGASVIVSTLVFAGLFVCAEPVVVLIAGPKFVASAGPVRILAGSAILAGISALLRFAAVALDQQRRALRADAIGACAAVIAHLVLIPRFGIIGAALGKLSGDVVTCLAATLVLRRQLRPTILVSVVAGGLGAAGLAGSVALLTDTGMPALLACALSGPLVLAAVLIVPRVRRELAPLSAPETASLVS